MGSTGKPSSPTTVHDTMPPGTTSRLTSMSPPRPTEHMFDSPKELYVCRYIKHIDDTARVNMSSTKRHWPVLCISDSPTRRVIGVMPVQQACLGRT